MFLNTLGMARCRTGDWEGALEALEESMRLHSGGDASDRHFVAMARWHLGKREEAPSWYDRAVAWAEERAPRDPQLRRFREEAAELLGAK